LDADVAATLDFLPFVVTSRWVSFDNSDVADFRSTPSIALVMKTVKYLNPCSKPLKTYTTV
jgi:hypothetical protein